MWIKFWNDSSLTFFFYITKIVHFQMSVDFLHLLYYIEEWTKKNPICDTVRVVSQLFFQLHSALLQLIQLFLQLKQLGMDVLYWDVLIRLHLQGLIGARWELILSGSLLDPILHSPWVMFCFKKQRFHALRLISGKPCPGAGGLAGRAPFDGRLSDLPLEGEAFLLNGFSLQNRWRNKRH